MQTLFHMCNDRIETQVIRQKAIVLILLICLLHPVFVSTEVVPVTVKRNKRDDFEINFLQLVSTLFAVTLHKCREKIIFKKSFRLLNSSVKLCNVI